MFMGHQMFSGPPITIGQKMLQQDTQQLIDDAHIKAGHNKLDQLLKGDAELINDDAWVIYFEGAKAQDIVVLQIELHDLTANHINIYRDKLLKKYGFK